MMLIKLNVAIVKILIIHKCSFPNKWLLFCSLGKITEPVIGSDDIAITT